MSNPRVGNHRRSDGSRRRLGFWCPGEVGHDGFFQVAGFGFFKEKKDFKYPYYSKNELPEFPEISEGVSALCLLPLLGTIKPLPTENILNEAFSFSKNVHAGTYLDGNVDKRHLSTFGGKEGSYSSFGPSQGQLSWSDVGCCLPAETPELFTGKSHPFWAWSNGIPWPSFNQGSRGSRDPTRKLLLATSIDGEYE